MALSGAVRTGSVYSAATGEDAAAPAVSAANVYLGRVFTAPLPSVSVEVAANDLKVTISRPKFRLLGFYPGVNLSVTETLPLP